MAGQYWQPASLSNNPVAYPGIPGVPSAYATGVSGGYSSRSVPLGGGARPNPFGIPANTWTGAPPPTSYSAPVTEGGWGQYDVENQRRTNAQNAAKAAALSQQYANLRGGSGATPGGYGAGGGFGGGYGGGAGGGNGQLQNLIGQFQNAMNHANAANEARYQDINKGYQQRFETGMNQLQGMGAQEGRDINELYDKQRAQQNQNLIGRGLGNSTVQATMNAGNDRERAAELGRLNERVRQQTIGTAAGLSGDELQLMERKQEAGPSYGQLAQLAQGLGTAGYGAGGGAGGFGGAPAYDTGGLGYQNPMFGFGANGGGWGGYGNNSLTPGQLASMRRNNETRLARQNQTPLPPGTNRQQLVGPVVNPAANPAWSTVATQQGDLNTLPLDAYRDLYGFPPWAQDYQQILAQTLADAFGG